MQGLPKLGVLLRGGLYSKGYSVSASIFGVPLFWETTRIGDEIEFT